MANIQRTESLILVSAYSSFSGARTEDMRLPSAPRINEDSRKTPGALSSQPADHPCHLQAHGFSHYPGQCRMACLGLAGGVFTGSQAAVSGAPELAPGKMGEMYTGILKTGLYPELPSTPSHSLIPASLLLGTSRALLKGVSDAFYPERKGGWGMQMRADTPCVTSSLPIPGSLPPQLQDGNCQNPSDSRQPEVILLHTEVITSAFSLSSS